MSRLFRHSSIYIRTDRGIKTPQDLKGKTIGLPEYQMTANVWVRGMLQEEYGVHAARHQMAARRAGGAGPRGAREDFAAAGDRPAGGAGGPLDLRHAGEGRDRRILSARAPSCFLRGAPNVARLFPDYPAAEEAYFKKTKLFPIMHAIGIRRSIVEKHPWVAVNVYKAFLQGQGAVHARARPDRASARDAAVAGAMRTTMRAR